MTEPIERPTEQPPKDVPFQFGLKHLLAAPVAVVVVFAVAAWPGEGLAVLLVVLLVVLVLAIAGLWFPATRRLSVAGIVILVAVVFLLPERKAARPLARRVHCSNNLKQIAIALDNYRDTHGSFAPAYIADENGRPMHSWRVLILPFMEQQAVYEQYSFDEPWDGPNNRKLAELAIDVFNCPAEHRKPSTMTNYVVVVGPDTAWPGNEPTKLGDFADGTSRTLLVVEVANSGIHWMEPRDLHVIQMAPGVNPKGGQGISSLHPTGANVVLADGAVFFIRNSVSPAVLKALVTINGGDSIDPDEG